ncbi:hypothetical protein QZH41_019967, partial [Actinostola sp. cb2023]
LNKSNSLEDVRQVSTADKKVNVYKDEEDASDVLDDINVALIPGVPELDKKIANAEHNLQVEWRACSGMKTILQMLVHDPDKHNEMEGKITRSQQKITEWKDITNGLKNDRTFLIQSYPKRKKIEDSIALLETDLEKQIRSQKSLQVLLNVVEESRKEEVYENLCLCESIITNLQSNIAERKGLHLKRTSLYLQVLTDYLLFIESLQNLHQPKPNQSTQKHIAQQREKVVNELIHTEQDYLRDLQLCLKYFAEELKNSKVVESDILFGNMKSVVDMSSKLLNSFEKAVQGKDADEQELGKCFVDTADEIEGIYAQYCRNHDDAIGLLEKLPFVSSIHLFSTKCWDHPSFLIKPVQPFICSSIPFTAFIVIELITPVLIIKYKRVEESGSSPTNFRS